jgi:23S rRNA pseudouridine2605 synthase
LNAEQLNSARLARWSQNGEARLTLEAAAEWLNSIGFCSYVPIGSARSAAPASFLEAVVGRPAQIPSAGERSRANDLLARMIDNSAAVPLKLGSSLGEQPDCIASPEALRYIYALRGSRNFKAGPSTVGNEKVTPLALHCWQAIREQGPLDVAALQPILGRDMTEAAILRALHELWSGMHIFPMLRASGPPAQWEILPRRFPQQVAAGAATGQAEAQSAMVSLHLHAVVAAPEEDVLAALSPFAPQSKLREVIRGLGSMRQLDIIDIGGRAHVCLQGGLLPEMVIHLSEESLAPPQVEPQLVQVSGDEVVDSLTVSSEIAIEREPRRAFPPSSGDASGEAGKFVPKKFVPQKFIPKRSETRKPAEQRFGLQATGQPSSFRDRDFRGERPGVDARRLTPRDPKVAGEQGARNRDQRWKSSGERRGFKASGFKPAKPWRAKEAGDRPEGVKPWTKRAATAPDAPRAGRFSQEDSPRRWDKPRDGAARSDSGARKPYASKPSGFRSSGFKSAGGGKPWAAKTGEKSSRRWEKSRPDAGARGIRQPSGERSAASHGLQSAERKPWKNRPVVRESAEFAPSDFRSGGATSARPKSGAPKSKPWVSKGAASRVGSARSFAARRSRTNDGAAPRTFGRRDENPRVGAEGAKPWKKRAYSQGAGFETRAATGKPPRREKFEDSSASRPAGKRDAKPFWAKNPRGGKGSAPASRSNRPRVKSGGKKKSGKKK